MFLCHFSKFDGKVVKPVWSRELVWQQGFSSPSGEKQRKKPILPSAAQEDTLQYRWFFSQETVYEGEIILVRKLYLKLIKSKHVKYNFGVMKMF